MRCVSLEVWFISITPLHLIIPGWVALLQLACLSIILHSRSRNPFPSKLVSYVPIFSSSAKGRGQHLSM